MTETPLAGRWGHGDVTMTTTTAGHEDLLALYDRAMPEVYGYLVRRCDSPATAEDLTADTFVAAVRARCTTTPAGASRSVG